MSSVIIISQGNELLQGSIHNSNATWLCQLLWNLGYQVILRYVLPDDIDAIMHTFIEASQQADIVISTGGMGPTNDDFTIEALAKAFHIPLEQNPDAQNHLKQHYAKSQRSVPEKSLKMSHLPQNCEIIDNPVGAAVGIHLKIAHTDIYCFPGVPAELYAMAPLVFNAQQRPYRLLELGLVGISESQAEDIAINNIPKDCIIGTKADKELILKIQIPNHYNYEEYSEKLSNIFQEYLFAINESNLSKVVGHLLSKRQETISTAESCTAGKMASWLASIPGSSAYLLMGGVTYSNEAKMDLCGVSEALLLEHGAVSPQVAIAMAEGIRNRSGSTWAISATGIAGPGGGSIEKPVGTVHIACAGPTGTVHQHLKNKGTRDQITDASMTKALFLLYRELLKLESQK